MIDRISVSGRAHGQAPRLILVGPYPAPWGGISVHVRALQQLARAEGIPVEVLDVGKGHDERDGEGGVYSAGSLGRFVSRLMAASTGNAVLHTHIPGNNLKSWLVALAACQARPGGLLTVHSGLAPALIEGSARVRSVVKLACSRYEWILCANHRIAASLEYAGVSPERIEVVPAFVADSSVRGAPPGTVVEARENWKVVIAAALAPGVQYGEEVLLGALERLLPQRPGIGCVLYGPGTDRPELAARLSSMGVSQRVLTLGEIDQAAAVGVLSVADVFVRPTLADGDSISVREALSLGIRVVASDVGHRPAGVHLFATGDAGELAERIGVALESPPPEPGAAGADMARRIIAWWRAVGLDEQGVFA